MKFVATQDLTLLDAVALLSPQSSKTTLRSWIKEGRIKVDEVTVKLANAPVLKGQTVTLGKKQKLIPGDIEILYEDRDLVIINKPVGLLSVATAFEKEETAHSLLKDYYRPRHPYVVHRLDQETSGVMIFAMSEEACERLKVIFEAHDIERCYTAIVEGEMRSPEGTWDTYQFEDAMYVVHTTTDPNRGRKAITHYKTEASSKKYSWLTLTLETGRKNQIRVHCQDAGHPVVGDRKYGAHSSPVKRLCLHAHTLGFVHPFTKKQMHFEAPPPEEFYRLINPRSV